MIAYLEVEETEALAAPVKGIGKGRAPWQLVVVAVLGCHWAVNFLVAWWMSGWGKVAPLGWLPLLGLAAPLVCLSERPLWRRLAVGLCVVEVGISGLLWFSSMLSFMNPLGFHVRVLGVKVFTVWSPPGYFVYFGVRGLLFLAAGILVVNAPARRSAEEES